MTDLARTSFYFHPDAIEGDGRELVGRRSAGQSFLKGYLRHAGGAEIRAFVTNRKAAKALEDAARALGDGRPVRATTTRLARDFAPAGAIFYPTPGFQNDAWHRMRTDPAACSLVGITHTVSTRRIIESLHSLVSEPIEDWDAIICTSHAVHSVVARQFELEAAYFRRRFGATRVPLPQLPVIPLGIEAADFAPRPGAREAFRALHDTPQDAIVVMSLGRISVVEKANPVPMLLALERAATATEAARAGREVHLWIAGWTSRAEEEALHTAAAGALCSRVKVRLLDGRDAALRRDIWAAADIFTLPADSIQETFGLVPVEAMAAGLPVVMPDWDGFRDTVRHGETGFLIPTRMAAPGMGPEIAARFADGRDAYLQYLTLVQSHIQIDVPAYAEAFARLIADPGLCAKMGAIGRAHVAATLDWKAIIPRYLDLARDLANRRARGAATTTRLSRLAPSPMQIDPFALYARYPTRAIGAEDRVRLSDGVPSTDRLALMEHLSARDLYQRHPAGTPDLSELATRIEAATGPDGDVALGDARIAAGLPFHRIAAMALLLAKADMLRIVSGPTEPAPLPGAGGAAQGAGTGTGAATSATKMPATSAITPPAAPGAGDPAPPVRPDKG